MPPIAKRSFSFPQFAMLQNPNVGDLLNTFVAEIGRETRLLQQLIALRTKPEDAETRESMAPLFATVDSSLSRLEDAVDTLRAYHAKHASDTAARARRLKQRHAIITARITAIQAHLPPDMQQILAQASKTDDHDSAKDRHASQPIREAMQENCKPSNEAAQLLHKSSRVKNGCQEQPRRRNTTNTKFTPSFDQKQVSSSSTDGSISTSSDGDDAQAIRGVSEEEMAGVPAYLKGRLTAARVNNTVLMLNKVVVARCKFLSRSLKTLNSQETDRWYELKAVEDECGVQDGRSFFTDDDIRKEGFSFDSTVKSVLNVLRHISVLKEVRGKSKLRIFLINK